MPNTFDKVYTKEELWEKANNLAMASSLKCNAQEAIVRVRNGELAGTLLSSELQRIFFLLEDVQQESSSDIVSNMNDDQLEKEWHEKIESLKNSGTVDVYAKNDLPICVVRHNGTLLEHEHADHKDYKFPVEIEYVGGEPKDYGWCGFDENGVETILPMTEDEIYEQNHESHALIYTDGCIALTLYETCPAIWSLKTGKCCGGSLWGNWRLKDTKGWRLTNESISKIKEYFEQK